MRKTSPGPDGRLVAADALPHFDDHVLRVGGVALDERQLQLLLEARRVRLEVARHRGELGVAPFVGEVGAHLQPFLREPVRGVDLLEAAPDLGRLATVVVDGGIRHPLLQLRVGALELVHECVNTSHIRAEL